MLPPGVKHMVHTYGFQDSFGSEMGPAFSWIHPPVFCKTEWLITQEWPLNGCHHKKDLPICPIIKALKYLNAGQGWKWCAFKMWAVFGASKTFVF